MPTSVASWPPLKVEVAFSTSPMRDPTWTDITRYCRAVQIRRGRDFELARYPTGTATITVDNRDRRFDPTYAASPYYPYVIPGRRIHVLAGSQLLTNASFETNTDGYGTLSAANTQVVSTAKFGVGSLQTDITNAVASGTYYDGWPTASGPVEVTAGESYTFSLYARLASASSKTMRLVIEWYSGGAGTFLSSSQTTATLDSTDWQRFSFTSTAPASATSIHLGYWTDSAQGAFTIYTDGWMFEAGSDLHLWHDAQGSLFDGFVESWPQDWAPPSEARSALECADGFKLLELRKLPGGYVQQVLENGPVAYFRLGETSGTSAADSSGNGLTATYQPAFPTATTGALQADNNGAVTLNGSTQYVSITNNAVLSSTWVGVEAWIKTTATTSMVVAERRTDPGDVGGWILMVNAPSPGYVRFYVYLTGATTGWWSTWSLASPAINNGAWRHIGAHYDGANIRLYVDGVYWSVSGALPGAINLVASPTTSIGRGIGGTLMFNGSIDEVAIYDWDIWSAPLRAHYTAGTGWLPQDYSYNRVVHVLNAVLWPVDLRTYHGGLEQVQSVTLSNVSALQHLQDTIDAEAGRLFIDGWGQVRYDGRDSFFLPPYTTPVATFGDNPLASSELRYMDLQAAYDDTQVWNDVRLTRIGGTQQVSEDTASIESYGRRTLQVSNMLNISDNNTLSLAQYRVSQYKNPQLRFVQMAIRPGIEERMWEQVLVRDLGDRVRIGRTPQGIGPPIAFDCWIEGIEHDIRPGFWESRWKVSRADAQTYWILGDATAGVLGTTTYLAF